MATTFEPCDNAVMEFAFQVMRQHHPYLSQAGVTVDYAFAIADDEGFAIKVRGQRVLARVKIVNLEDRARNEKDVKILIDKGWWLDATEAEREAVLDHEFTHVQFAKHWLEDGSPKWKTDDLGRPKLKIRQHDAESGIFFEVIKRHGKEATDFKQVAGMGKKIRELTQLQFWG